MLKFIVSVVKGLCSEYLFQTSPSYNARKLYEQSLKDAQTAERIDLEEAQEEAEEIWQGYDMDWKTQRELWKLRRMRDRVEKMEALHEHRLQVLEAELGRQIQLVEDYDTKLVETLIELDRYQTGRK